MCRMCDICPHNIKILAESTMYVDYIKIITAAVEKDEKILLCKRKNDFFVRFFYCLLSVQDIKQFRSYLVGKNMTTK